MFKKLFSAFLLIVGYLLSPLCWWNDLIFNLPIAYGFGWLGSLYSPQWFVPCAIIGYWLTNLIGILMMQFGVVSWVQDQPEPRNTKKDILTGVLSSTVYTVVIVGLFQLHILDMDFLVSALPK